MKYLQNPTKLITTIHLVTGFMAVVTGYFQLGIYARKVRLWLVSLGSGFVLSDAFMNFIAYFLTALYLMLLLLALGILCRRSWEQSTADHVHMHSAVL